MMDLSTDRVNNVPISRTYFSDNLTLMRQVPDGFFHLGIVDPPYGINAPSMQMGAGAPSRGGKSSVAVQLRKGRLNSGGGHMKNSVLVNSEIGWDNEIPPPEYFDELFRITQNQIIWGGNYFPLPPTRCIVCWDKLQPWDNFSKWEMAWTGFDLTAKMIRLSNHIGLNEKKIHPTQKPVKLYAWLLKEFANPGDRIIDTHLGSGSSRLAAFASGFDFWGIEADRIHFDDQEARFKNNIIPPAFEGLNQQSIFDK